MNVHQMNSSKLFENCRLYRLKYEVFIGGDIFYKLYLHS